METIVSIVKGIFVEINISIGSRLKEVREEIGLSQADFAKIAERSGAPGSTRQSQAKYEKGLASPSAAYLAALGQDGVDIVYVLTGNRALTSSAPISPEHRALLMDYCACSTADQAAIRRMAAALAAGTSAKPRKAGIYVEQAQSVTKAKKIGQQDISINMGKKKK